ncbi:MAG TPA: metal-dependent hydrolase [Planctomycetota bacterium]|jgi:L-ascorbate metabolism protein UlaG (beta-lactamase superfamily)
MPFLTYYGHSAIQLEDGKFTLLIDPFFSGNPLAPIKPAQIEKCDYILVTHGHGDHLGDTVALAKRHKSTVIATYELGLYLQQKEVTVHAMAVGGSHDFPFGRVKMTPALHGCGGEPDVDGVTPPANMPVGYLITFGKKVLYHAGDTALFSDMKLIGEKTTINVACLPIGDNFTMGIDDAARANEFLNAERCVPVHYNTYEVIKADAKAFAFKIEKQGKKCTILKPGERLEY